MRKPHLKHAGVRDGRPIYEISDRVTRPEDPGERQTWALWPTRPDSGVHVTHDTALKYSAVWACVQILSRTIAYLPWHVFSRRADGGRDLQDRHSVDWLLHTQPNQEMHAFTWRQILMSHVLTWGNGYAEIERDMAGRVMALWPITPDRVQPDRAEDGRLIYDVDNRRGANSVLDSRNVFHLKGLGFDGLQGYSVVTMAAQAVGLGMAAEQFGAAFFGNGAHLGGVLQHPGKLSDNSLKNLRESWDAAHKGAAKAGKPAILEEGMIYNRIGIPPNDAQFLETRQHQVNDICRWFGVPPHKVGDLTRATFSNIEHQAIEFVQDAIAPWVRALELEADIKLFGQNRGNLFTKMNLLGLLRGDNKARADYYKALWEIGVLSINEIREKEDMNPVDGGDLRMVPLNMSTLKQAQQAGSTGQPKNTDPAPAMDDEFVQFLQRMAAGKTESAEQDHLIIMPEGEE